MSSSSADVARLRAFNRFSTKFAGALDEHLLETPWTLTEARVLFELGTRSPLEVSALRSDLALDAGYLSRILGSFEARGLVARRRAPGDGRRQVAELTPRGRDVFRELDRRSARENRALLQRLPAPDRERLLAAADDLRALLGDTDAGSGTVTIRGARAGDFGWMIERHGILYAHEYGWDETFEGLVAEIVGGFARAHDPGCERAFVAELAGRRAGCVLCVRAEEGTAKLRTLLVEPWARGHGLGTRLVDECIAFARHAGYERIVLWTNDVLTDARRIYERAGFELVQEGAHRAFGHDLVEQTWSLGL